MAQEHQDMAAETSRSNEKTLWTSLWMVLVPPKVKTMVWQLCRDTIPTRVNLRKRSPVVDITCPLCRSWFESNGREIWDCRGKQLRKLLKNATNYKEVLWGLLSESKPEVVGMHRSAITMNDPQRTERTNRIGIRAALAFNLKGVMKATHAEALVVWHGINLAKELGLRSLLVETDCSRLVTKMYNWEGFVASWS
ncbi:hypothetical protein M9H77_24082 [Catharanthus roseus]|uniref:Uncharacterized protein n=1 Tax=Catharanthus roseus TaxID=4058 RepID=A0ACC0AW26_CATRO|nr:hypothetical protein M9H77_24082 [Catharanthus roseus]